MGQPTQPAREQRVALMRQIEAARGSRVISYVTSERQGMQAQIGDDLPHVKAWMNRLLDRPAVRSTL